MIILGCSEAWLDFTTSIDSNDLSLKSYDLNCVDNLENVKEVGVSVYYTETLTVQVLQTKRDQCSITKITLIIFKKYRVISLYRSPSQIPEQSNNFFQSFEKVWKDIFKIKSSFVLIKGDFNCRNFNWYLAYSITSHRSHVEALTSFYGLHQLIKTPTLVLQHLITYIYLVSYPVPTRS